MAKYLLVVESDPSEPSREKEYQEWYNKIHIPDILQTKGFVKATRYEVVEVTKGAKPRFVAMYEIETNDLADVKTRHSKNMKEKQAQGRISTSINSSCRAIYKEILTYPQK